MRGRGGGGGGGVGRRRRGALALFAMMFLVIVAACSFRKITCNKSREGFEPSLSSGVSTVFDEIYNSNGWKSDESVSGPGSTLEKTKSIRKALPEIIKKYNIYTVFDCPCGDVNWIRHIFDDIPKYTGGDIVQPLIEKNRQLYSDKDFIVFDLIHDALGDYDLLFARDCLFHLSYSDIISVCKQIKKSNVKYILTTNFLNRKNHDIQTGGWRPLCLQEPPFNFPEPVVAVNEDEVGEYSDKHMGLWKKEQIPDY